MTTHAIERFYLWDHVFSLMAADEYLTLDDMYAHYATHSAEIVGYLMRRGLEAQTAEDLMHDTFFNACKQVSKGGLKVANVRAWLFRIAHNKAISRYRKRTETPSAQIEVSTNDFSVQLDEKILAASISEFVQNNFSDREKEIFELRIVQALSFQEAAQILGMSKTTLMRIDEGLIKRIKDHFGDIR